jgi:UPF0716 family protein affecting phage T7 exclusion
MAAHPSWRRRVAGACALLWPVLELALLIQVGARLGVVATLLLLLAGAVAGSLVLRRVGAVGIQRLTTANGHAPAAGPVRPGSETALLVLAGVLLIVPGFLSDVAGLALLLPQVRRALGRRVGNAVLRRFEMRSVRIVPGQVLDGGAVEHVDVQVTDVQVTDVRGPGYQPPYGPLTGPDR